MTYTFEWNLAKEIENLAKHGYSFQEAMQVFADPNAIHLEDTSHSSEETRFYAVGRINSGIVVTVRYTMREHKIRIYGAAHWRKWSKFYEQST